MPSSHAANWFAATMILFIYYRRSLWFMLPGGDPGQLLAHLQRRPLPERRAGGAILGAGYAAASVWSLNALWQWAGRNWFPLWWQSFPSLLDPSRSRGRGPDECLRSTDASAAESPLCRSAFHRGPALAAAGLHLDCGAACWPGWPTSPAATIQLSRDEAYQWLWSKHLALSYYSKPPLIAYTQFLGTSLWGDTAFGVRFFSPVIAAILSLILLRFFAREVNARAGFFLLLIITATPLMSVGAVLMTVDPLSVLFWTAAMLAGWRAVQENATDPPMALGRPLDGPGVSEQIHRAVPIPLLGRVLRPLAARAQTPAAPRAVPGVAGEPGLRPAGLDLELRSTTGSPSPTWPGTRGSAARGSRPCDTWASSSAPKPAC